MSPLLARSKLVEFMTSGALPPPMVTVPVDVPVFMLVAKLEEAFRLTAAPDTVRPALPVSRPALVMVPVLVVDMAPVVVMASPAVLGDKVVPVRDQ